MTEDARIRRTKEKLHTAFVELLQEQPVSEITPGKICDRAGVNRSTFYRHYRSTTQLKAEIESRILEHVDWLGGILDSENRREELLTHLTHFHKRLGIFQALTSNRFFDNLFEKVGAKAVEEALRGYPKYAERFTEEEYRKECLFYISATLGVIYTWFMTGMEESVEEIAEYIDGKLEGGFLQIEKE